MLSALAGAAMTPPNDAVRHDCVKTVYRQDNGDGWGQDFLTEGAFVGSVTALSPDPLHGVSALSLGSM